MLLDKGCLYYFTKLFWGSSNRLKKGTYILLDSLWCFFFIWSFSMFLILLGIICNIGIIFFSGQELQELISFIIVMHHYKFMFCFLCWLALFLNLNFTLPSCILGTIRKKFYQMNTYLMRSLSTGWLVSWAIKNNA